MNKGSFSDFINAITRGCEGLGHSWFITGRLFPPTAQPSSACKHPSILPSPAGPVRPGEEGTRAADSISVGLRAHGCWKPQGKRKILRKGQCGFLLTEVKPWSFAEKRKQGRNTELTLGCAGGKGSWQAQPEPLCARVYLSKGDRRVTGRSLPSSMADGISRGTDLTPPAPTAPRRRCRMGLLISPLNYCRSNCDPSFPPARQPCHGRER